MVAQLMTVLGSCPPLLYTICYDRRGADQIECGLEPQRIQRRQDIVKVGIDGVVIGK